MSYVCCGKRTSTGTKSVATKGGHEESAAGGTRKRRLGPGSGSTEHHVCTWIFVWSSEIEGKPMFHVLCIASA